MRQIILISIPVVFLAALLFFVFMVRDTGSRAAACTIGTCPLALHASDNRRTFVYKVGDTFAAEFGSLYPYDRLSCTPSGTVRPSASMPGAFETTEQGTCMLQGPDFKAYIIVREIGQ